MARDSEDVRVEEREEIIDGKIQKVRRTIRTTKVVEEVFLDDEPTTSSSSVNHHDIHLEVANAADTLACRCHTPSGKTIPCEFIANDDGTVTVDLTILESGMHTVSAETAGKKIPGSPFLVRIAQKPDTKSLFLYGDGLRTGLLDNANGLFHVSTKGAGPGELQVTVHGPKNGFRVSMRRDMTDNRVVNVSYHPVVSGIYTLSVHWSGAAVPANIREVYLAPDVHALTRWKHDPATIRFEEGLGDKY